MNKIHVQAAPDRIVPIHTSDNVNGGSVMLVGASISPLDRNDATKPGDAIEVFESTSIRRGVRSGDLVVTKGTTTAKHAPTKMRLHADHADMQAKKPADAEPTTAAKSSK